MKMKVLALGKRSVTQRVVRALAESDVEVVCQSETKDAINCLHAEHFDLVLVDGYMKDMESTCYRISWLCHTPIVLIINGTQADWGLLRNLDVDGFIPEEAGNMELMAYFNSIIHRTDCKPTRSRVLIIEDDEHTREALRMAFQIYWPEAQLASAANGEEGLLLAHGQALDVILLDLKLPDISGFEILRKIRSLSQVPVVIISANRNQDDVIKCIQLGANDYIVKPYQVLELMSRIKQQVTMGVSISNISIKEYSKV